MEMLKHFSVGLVCGFTAGSIVAYLYASFLVSELHMLRAEAIAKVKEAIAAFKGEVNKL